MGETLQAAGYRTAAFGKWHIGDQPDTRPPARGFDESCGLMYSNDMWEFNPLGSYKAPLHFWENGKVKIDRLTPELQPMLTTWYTQHAVDFIHRNRSNPFLLYIPHTMPHVPLYASQKFKDKSGAGRYGDVMMEIDWSVGEVMKSLQKAGVEDHTLVFFSSDNGPWLVYGNWAGKTPYREGKFTTFDGGTRSACIMRYPGAIKGLPARRTGRIQPARVLSFLLRTGVPGRLQRRWPMEAPPPAQLSDRGGAWPRRHARPIPAGPDRALSFRHGEGPVRDHQRNPATPRCRRPPGRIRASP
jgi:arylsulfatase A-like enzyme